MYRTIEVQIEESWKMEGDEFGEAIWTTDLMCLMQNWSSLGSSFYRGWSWSYKFEQCSAVLHVKQIVFEKSVLLWRLELCITNGEFSHKLEKMAGHLTCIFSLSFFIDARWYERRRVEWRGSWKYTWLV